MKTKYIKVAFEECKKGAKAISYKPIMASNLASYDKEIIHLIEVTDQEAELVAMLEECKKSFDWVFENCTPPVITDEESAEDMIHFIFYRIQELDSLIQKLKSDE